jgi:hypothetical protein
MELRLFASFKELNLALMLLCRCAGIERAEISAFPGFGIFLRRVQTVLTGFEFSDHKNSLLHRYI